MRSLKIDLRSDTVSVPNHAMRNAIARAEVGDDVFGEDPTVNRLEEMMSDMTGFDRAVFMPTGTMSNGVAIRAMTSHGDEVICGSRSHMYCYEGAQYSALGGIALHRIDENSKGCIPPEEVRTALSRGSDMHFAPRTLVAIENTHNIMGGLIVPEDMTTEILSAAAERGAAVYLDGARLWHVHAASGQSLRKLTAGFRMVSMCFSKGLGCPVGSILLCSSEDEERVRFLRKQHGGAMRQSGLLAAACIYAVEHNLPALPRTHEYAKRLARGIEHSPVLKLQRDTVDTNILIVRTPDGKADVVADALASLEIGCLALSPSTIRFVTHLSLSERAVKYAADVLSAFGG